MIINQGGPATVGSGGQEQGEDTGRAESIKVVTVHDNITHLAYVFVDFIYYKNCFVHILPVG